MRCEHYFGAKQYLFVKSEYNERSSADSCVPQRVTAKTGRIHDLYHVCELDKIQMNRRTDGRTDNLQILFSPGCDQPLRDNYRKRI